MLKNYQEQDFAFLFFTFKQRKGNYYKIMESLNGKMMLNKIKRPLFSM